MNHVVNTRVSGSFNSDHPVIEAIAALASRVSSAVVYFFKTVSQVWAAGRQLISRILFPAHPMTKTVESSGPNLDLAPNPLSLLTSGLGADDRDYVVNETKQISADQRDRAIKYTIPLITKNMGGCERNNVLRAVAAIPKDKQEDVINLVQSCFTDEMNGYDRFDILKTVAKIPPDKRNFIEHENDNLVRVIYHTRLLMMRDNYCSIANMGDIIRLCILEQMARISPLERVQAIENARKFITSNIDEMGRIHIIRQVIQIPKNQEADITLLALSLFTHGMSGRDRAYILEVLRNIPANTRADVVQLALLVNMRDNNRAPILEAVNQELNRIPSVERADVIRHARGLIPLMFRIEGRDVIEILIAVKSIPAVQRADVVRHARQLLAARLVVNVNTVTEILQNILNTPIDEREGLFGERPVRNRNLQARAREGINVHANERDQRVQDAIKLLDRKITLNPIKTDHAINAFTTYLENLPSIDPKKEKAKKALLTPREENEPFGPLLGDGMFTILGYAVRGKELVARLWIFASSLQEPEQENAKSGMVTALANSYESGQRICNQGKTQRLAVAVLQGRLEGVKIDDEAPLLLSTEKALALFFEDERRKTMSKSELLKAAEEFLKTAKNVDAAAFNKGIEDYIRLQYSSSSAG